MKEWRVVDGGVGEMLRGAKKVLQKRQLITKPDLADASRYYRIIII